MMRFGAFVVIRDSDMDAGTFADEHWHFDGACTMVFLPEKWSRQS